MFIKENKKAVLIIIANFYMFFVLQYKVNISNCEYKPIIIEQQN